MRSFARDVRYAFRQLRATPGFSALAIVSLAIGIGAPTTIFTLTNAVFLRPLPVADAERLVYAYETTQDGSGFHSFSYPQYRDLSGRSRTMSGMTAFDNVALSVATTGEPRVALGLMVTGNYFQVLGTTPQLGRFFAADEDGPGTMRPVAVVSDGFWRTHLSADPGAVGRNVRINGQPFTVIGVTRPEFGELSPLIKPEIFTTMGTAGTTRPTARLDSRGYNTFQIVGRLASTTTREAAEGELEGLARQIGADNPDEAQGRGVDLFPFTSMPTEARGGIVLFMSLLMGFAALILFVACGNVASMLLARGIQRRRELAIRTALGAGRAQLLAQLVVETVILFLGGAAAALGLALAAARAIVAFKPPTDFPIHLDVPIDWRVFVFTLGVALVVGALFGLLPGLRATRADLAGILKEEAGTVSGRSRARSAVVIGQLAFTFMLLIAAGLVGKSLGGALRLDPGFARAGIHVAITDIEMGRLDDAQAYILARSWRDAVAATPGVADAGLTTRAPLSTGNSTNSFKVEGGEGTAATQFQSVDWAGVSPEFFPTLGIRLVAGRNFGASDVPTSERVAILSEAAATRYFGTAAAAVGRVLQTGDRPEDRRVVVGVAADTKVRSVSESPRAMMYEPLSQLRVRKVTMVARSSRPDMAAVMRGELRRLNTAVPLMASMPYEDFIGIALLPQRLAAVVAGILGIAGLLLAALGVYGIVAYSVTQRTREIGIRMAVGATPGSVVSTMATTGLRLVAIGIGAGLLLSLAGTRVLSGFLLGVSPTDPWIFAAITLGLTVIALAACAVPARRAAKVDPLTALRSN
ncbi:MAG TPA: ABC transporter permease [Gemmatimonadaceae bacterium]|nr:ABC transporter permease [Gemmatimonadaceae bacterium]